MKIKLTKENFEKINKLILEKCRSSPNEQKVIRRKIRDLGFSYEYFYGKKKVEGGYKVCHFVQLVEDGLIVVV